MAEQSVKARAIIEMLGAPKEYIEKTLKDYVAKLKDEGLNVLDEDYHEAQKQDELFSAFVELDIQFKNLTKVLDFCFESMPSSIEIYEPEKLELPAIEFNNLLNDLQARLHEVDMYVKTTEAEKEVLDKNAIQILQNFIITELRHKPQKLEDLSPVVGIPPEQLRAFIDKLVEKGVVVMEDELLKADETKA